MQRQHFLHLPRNCVMTSGNPSFSEGRSGWPELQPADAVDIGILLTSWQSKSLSREQTSEKSSSQYLSLYSKYHRKVSKFYSRKMLETRQNIKNDKSKKNNRDDSHKFSISEYRNRTYYCCPFIGSHDMVASGLSWSLAKLPEGRGKDQEVT